MEPHLPCYERPACLAREEIMTFMEKCDRWNNKEFRWCFFYEPIEEEWQQYTCTKCIDHKNKVENIKWFVALHRMRIPPEVFQYMCVENH